MSKILLTLGLIGLCATELVFVLTASADLPDVEYVTVAINLIAFVVSLILLLLSMRYGIQTSALQFYFWLLSAVFGIAILRTTIKRQV